MSSLSNISLFIYYLCMYLLEQDYLKYIQYIQRPQTLWAYSCFFQLDFFFFLLARLSRWTRRYAFWCYLLWLALFQMSLPFCCYTYCNDKHLCIYTWHIYEHFWEKWFYESRIGRSKDTHISNTKIHYQADSPKDCSNLH